MIKRHLANVLTYFRHRITKTMSEGLHAGKIQALKKMASGFRNRDTLKTAIYFHCGGLGAGTGRVTLASCCTAPCCPAAPGLISPAHSGKIAPRCPSLHSRCAKGWGRTQP